MKGDSHHCYYRYLSNKRQTVFTLLNTNALLTAKQLANEIGIPQDKRTKGEMAYLKKLRYDWKSYHPKERSSIRSFPDSVHNVFYKGVLPEKVVGEIRAKLFEVFERAGWDKWVYPERPMTDTGWKITKSKNKALLYKSRLGRIRFFGTGTVEIFVAKPANLGKCLQLFSNAFTTTYLIENIRVVDEFRRGLLVRWHGTYKAGQRLPYMKVTTFEDTHNLIFISGDRTHPDCYEFIVEYNAFMERTRRLWDNMNSFFNQFSPDRSMGPKPLDKDYST